MKLPHHYPSTVAFLHIPYVGHIVRKTFWVYQQKLIWSVSAFLAFMYRCKTVYTIKTDKAPFQLIRNLITPFAVACMFVSFFLYFLRVGTIFMLLIIVDLFICSIEDEYYWLNEKKLTQEEPLTNWTFLEIFKSLIKIWLGPNLILESFFFLILIALQVLSCKGCNLKM